MITLCDSQDDEHASFPHRLVRPVTARVYVVEKERTVRYEICPVAFVICALCDHWVACPAGSCTCRAGCHEKP